MTSPVSDAMIEREKLALNALRQITEYPTCLAPVLIAMATLDQMGVRHRGTFLPRPNPRVRPGAKLPNGDLA